MKISVVTPSLNQAKFIDKTIQSVLTQKDVIFEHIVVDGGSHDGTVELLKKYSHLKWVSEPDRSRTHAVNKGFAMASGDILAWLSSDDEYTPGTFARVVEFFKTHPDCRALMGRAKVIDADGHFLFDQDNPPNFNHETLIRFWKHPMPPQPSLFFRKEAFVSAGFLDENYPAYMDYDFILKLSKSNPIEMSQDFYSLIRIHDDSGSVRDIASGSRDRVLLSISKKYWGTPGSADYNRHKLSYFLSYPGLLWTSHYDQFAFAVRKKTGVFHARDFRVSQVAGLAPLFFRYPLPFMTASLKAFFRKFKHACG